TWPQSIAEQRKAPHSVRIVWRWKPLPAACASARAKRPTTRADATGGHDRIIVAVSDGYPDATRPGGRRSSRAWGQRRPGVGEPGGSHRTTGLGGSSVGSQTSPSSHHG